MNTGEETRGEQEKEVTSRDVNGFHEKGIRSELNREEVNRI